MKKLFLYTICIIILTACHTKANQPITDSTPVYTVPDDKAITQAVHDAYASVTFKKGDTPNYEAIKMHFIPKAQLIITALIPRRYLQ